VDVAPGAVLSGRDIHPYNACGCGPLIRLLNP